MLLLFQNRYYITNVGDTRAYLAAGQLRQITKDHTVVAREIERGSMTQEQARLDPRRNVLLQCVGASPVIDPDFFSGEARPGSLFLLCSDGFRHEITEQEIFSRLNPAILRNENDMRAGAVSLVELNKQRQEQDNISIALVKVC